MEEGGKEQRGRAAAEMTLSMILKLQLYVFILRTCKNYIITFTCVNNIIYTSGIMLLHPK